MCSNSFCMIAFFLKETKSKPYRYNFTKNFLNHKEIEFVSQAKRYFQPPCRRLSFYLLSFCCNHAVFQNSKNKFICYNKRVLKGVLQQTMRDASTERVLDFYDYSLKIFENSPVHPHNCCLIMCKRTLIKNWKEALLVRIKQCLHNLNVIFAFFKQHVVSTVTILLQLSPRIFFSEKHI